MLKRIVAVAFIFCCTSFAWLILGSTIYARTYAQRPMLRGRVASTWGAPQTQTPPRACLPSAKTWLAPDKSRINTALRLEHRQKGLLWYSTYHVDFLGDYVFRNPGEKPESARFEFRFPAEKAIYDDFVMELDGVSLRVTSFKDAASASTVLDPGKPVTLRIGYRSQGLDSWTYGFGGDVAQVRDFQLHMRTNFRDIDFPDNSLSPTRKREIAGGWDLEWSFKNLISGVQIGMAMPEKLQPGPLAGNISYFAPVSLLFFFFLMFLITAMRGIDLHPMNYFFLACAFFAFHLLLAYLVDHISIHAAFAVSSLVSVVLVVNYLRLAAGLCFAALEAGGAQLIYLVLFSYAFFLKGFTGLAVTIGAILTLFMVMQMTGRIRWSEKFA